MLTGGGELRKSSPRVVGSRPTPDASRREPRPSGSAAVFRERSVLRFLTGAAPAGLRNDYRIGPAATGSRGDPAPQGREVIGPSGTFNAAGRRYSMILPKYKKSASMRQVGPSSGS